MRGSSPTSQSVTLGGRVGTEPLFPLSSPGFLAIDPGATSEHRASAAQGPGPQPACHPAAALPSHQPPVPFLRLLEQFTTTGRLETTEWYSLTVLQAEGLRSGCRRAMPCPMAPREGLSPPLPASGGSCGFGSDPCRHCHVASPLRLSPASSSHKDTCHLDEPSPAPPPQHHLILSNDIAKSLLPERSPPGDPGRWEFGAMLRQPAQAHQLLLALGCSTNQEDRRGWGSPRSAQSSVTCGTSCAVPSWQNRDFCSGLVCCPF